MPGVRSCARSAATEIFWSYTHRHAHRSWNHKLFISAGPMDKQKDFFRCPQILGFPAVAAVVGLYTKSFNKCIISGMNRVPVVLFSPSSPVCSFCSWFVQHQGDDEEENIKTLRWCLYFTQAKRRVFWSVVRSWRNVHRRQLCVWHRKGFPHREHIPPVAGTRTESSRCPLPVTLYLI